jgi:alpha-glucosidase
MGYINPYLVEGGALFAEAAEKGYFVRRADGSNYLFDFGEFNCGVVDLTMPEAFGWYKDVIKTNLIGMGFRGWMADFGEYLPADAVCFGGSGLARHNEWPALWARCNREAVEESGEPCVFFMRAGATFSQRYATLIWAGDQCVDWSDDDGLPSVITAALTLGMSGFGLHCSDTGGYTTLFHLKRDEELLLRWLEFSCFTPVMRTHEGNRPESNVQLYDNERTLGRPRAGAGSIPRFCPICANACAKTRRRARLSCVRCSGLPRRRSGRGGAKTTAICLAATCSCAPWSAPAARSGRSGCPKDSGCRSGRGSASAAASTSFPRRWESLPCSAARTAGGTIFSGKSPEWVKINAVI